MIRFFVPAAHAQVQLNTGIHSTFPQLMERIVGWLATSGVAVCAALFLIGAFMMVLYSSKPDKASQGKDIMIQSMIGLFVILGAYGILRTVFYILI
jgi:hypothetical protein